MFTNKPSDNKNIIRQKKKTAQQPKYSYTVCYKIYLSCLRKAVNSSFHRLYWYSKQAGKKVNGTFLLENGSFAIMSHKQNWRRKKKKFAHTYLVVGCKSQTTIQLPNRAHKKKSNNSHSNTSQTTYSSPSMCAVDCHLAYIRIFLSAPSDTVSTLPFFFSRAQWALISFHINDFCYFVSRWQYALDYWNKKHTNESRKKRIRKTVTSCVRFKRHGEKDAWERMKKNTHLEEK